MTDLALELTAAAEDHRERLTSYALSEPWRGYHECTALLLERAAARVEALEAVAKAARRVNHPWRMEGREPFEVDQARLLETLWTLDGRPVCERSGTDAAPEEGAGDG